MTAPIDWNEDDDGTFYKSARASAERVGLPLEIENATSEVLSVPKADVRARVEEYIDRMEVETTNKWCACTWKVHPDDMEEPEGKRRVVRIDENPICRVHTKAGFIMGFFEWLFTERGKETDGS